MPVVLSEGHFLRWPEQILVFHLKTDDLLQFLLLSQALGINLNEEGGKGKSYFTRHIVVTVVEIAVMLLSGVQFPAIAALPSSDPDLLKQPAA